MNKLLAGLLLTVAGNAAVINYSIGPTTNALFNGITYTYSGASGNIDLSSDPTPVDLGSIIIGLDSAIPHSTFTQGFPLTSTIDGYANQFGIVTTFTFSAGAWHYAALYSPRSTGQNPVIFTSAFVGTADGITATEILGTGIITPEPNGFILAGIALIALTTRRALHRGRQRIRQIG